MLKDIKGIKKDLKSHFYRLDTFNIKTDSATNLDSDFGYSGDVFYKELSTAHKYRKQIEEGFKEKMNQRNFINTCSK